jgi:tRNA modification GTPase
MNDTIVAISTAFGEGAVALLRISGPHAIEIADRLWKGRKRVSELPTRMATFGSVAEQEHALDDVLLTVFRAPRSYTGEDVVEIAGHGGILVSRRILEAILRAGARAANPGEFTQRAYLHGKMDLTQAEAVMDLITAQTDLALRAATEQLEGKLGDRIRTLRQQVLEILAHVEAFIDFPEEDIDPDTDALLRTRIDVALAAAQALLDTASQGKILREGLRTVIYGAPNVGKSSLLNLLLGHERAIVSHHPGTTRDVLEETINLHGIPLRLIDTAGVRHTEDEIERAGIERTHRQLERADMRLRIVDASQPPAEQLAASALDSLTATQTARELLILNKCDLGEHPDWTGVTAVRMSCLRGEGLDPLGEAILSSATTGSGSRDWTCAINARHAHCLERTSDYLRAARRAFDDGLSAEFIAEELRAAMNAVGDIVGQADTEELLGVIFSQFCIGK